LIRSRLAYTITELLVVVAVLLVLAALLFPVFSSSIERPKAAVCINNFRQVSLSTLLYADDYEDRLVPVQLQPGGNGNSHTDRTWVQLVLPYATSFLLFRCPSDYTNQSAETATFDQDLVPGDTYSEYYTASLHVNLGYNYQYLAPILKGTSRWVSSPITTTEVTDPTRTLLFVDSTTGADRSSSTATGGGATVDATGGSGSGNSGGSGQTELLGGGWLVEPPCRFETLPDGTVFDTFTKTNGHSSQVYSATVGWKPLDSSSSLQYGGAWPRHFGRLTVSRLDGSAKLLTVSALTDGCNPLPSWSGSISNSAKYLWTSQ